MSWKQPIPTDLRSVFGDDHLSRLIYQEFLIMACNSKQVKNVNGQIFQLERGQCFYTTLDLSKIFRTHRNSVVNSIKRLNSLYNKIDNRTTPKGSIVTILNYDDIVSLDNRIDNKIDNSRTTAGQQSDINKSDKSVKTVKSDNITIQVKEILDFYNQTFNKNSKSTVWSKNFEHWLKTYSLEEIKIVITRLNYAGWWATKKGIQPSLEFLFRRKNTNGDCDYISQLLEIEEMEPQKEEVYKFTDDDKDLTNFKEEVDQVIAEKMAIFNKTNGTNHKLRF